MFFGLWSKPNMVTSCPNCGEKITDIKMTYSLPKPLWILVAIMMLAGVAMSVYMVFWFLPAIGVGDDASFSQELSIESYDIQFIGRPDSPRVAVTGELRNQGPHAWQHIDLQLEMFKGNVFVGEATKTLSLSIQPGQSDFFRFTEYLEGIEPDDVSKHELKVVDAMVD